MIRVAVIGTGAFGREHARVYSEVTGSHLAAVCDIDDSRGREVAESYATDFFSDYHQVIGKVDAASLTVPTESHAAIACDLLAAGISVLVEKPIASTLDEADRIIKRQDAVERFCRLVTSNASTRR